MHPCLTVQEILANIFASYSHADTDEASAGIQRYSLNDRRTLACLARTCKAFSEPAIDVLWHTQTSIVPLVRCLPSDALRIDGKRGILRIKRDLLPSDFDRMLYYSPRIRAWDEGYTRWEIDDMVIPMIWSRRDSPCLLLPMLKHIANLSLQHFVHMAFFPRMIIGPKIRSIHITVHEWDLDDEGLEYPWDNFTSALKMVANSLTKFTITNKIQAQVNQGRDYMNLVPLFRDFSSIQTLNIHCIYIDHDAFAHLGSVLHLESLNVAIDAVELTKFLARPKDVMAFPKLKELALQTDNIVNCTKLIKRGCFKSLRSLEIMRLAEHGHWDLAPFFKSLQNHQSHSELQTLRILGDGCFAEDEECRVAKITPSTLEPLLSFRNLADFQITLDGTFALNDEFLMKMGTTFSKLRILRLFERSRRRAPKITLSGFLSFAAQCAELTRVTLRMNALEIPTFHTFGEIVPHPKIQSLDVATSPAERDSAIIAVLTVAFPGLSGLSYGWHYSDPYGETVTMPLTAIDERYRNCWKTVNNAMERVHCYY